MQKSYSEVTYVICHNGADIIHPVKVEAGTNLASGQPEFEEFNNEEAWKARLTELGYDVAKLEPPSARIGSLRTRAAEDGRPRGGLLTAEERKSLSPEERKALRIERKAALAKGSSLSATEAPKVKKAPAKAKTTRSKKKAS